MTAVLDKETRKPVVFYEDCVRAKVGERATLFPINHPRGYLNGQMCFTSEVLEVNEETGRIVTRNTIYERPPAEYLQLLKSNEENQ